MSTLIVVQARMSSTRLPGKVMKEVLGKPLLEYQLERLKCVSHAHAIVVATTTNAADTPIIELCQKLQVQSYRGSEEDVLSRYYEVAQKFKANTIVRVTSDCPLIDPQVMDQVIHAYLTASPRKDYFSNCLNRTYPRGLDTEVFSAKVLSEVHQKAVSKPDREHVTTYIYNHPESYQLGCVNYFEDQSHHRWTLDTIEDFELIRLMLEKLYPNKPEFSLEDCLDIHKNYPDWVHINSSISQKQNDE